MTNDEFKELEEHENREVVIKPGHLRSIMFIGEMGEELKSIKLDGVDIKQEDGILKIWMFEDK